MKGSIQNPSLYHWPNFNALKNFTFDFLKILKVAFSKFEFGCPYPPSQGQCFTEVAGPEPILHPVSDRRFFTKYEISEVLTRVLRY